MKYQILFLLLLITSIQALSQEKELSDIITSTAESLAGDESDPDAAAAYTDRLHELTEDPVKINSANADEISRLFFLSDFQVKALTDYITHSGKIVSVYELANIPGFNRTDAEMIIPFITLEYHIANNPDSARWRNTLLSNFACKRNSNNTVSLGSPWKILTKYKFTSGPFSGGFSAEKDPGEKFFSGNPPLPDFYSGNLSYHSNGILKKLIIGDYSARFGQGSGINTGIQRGISLVSPGYMSSSDEIKPYTSTEENKFFRGAAAQFSLRDLDLSIFISHNSSDASLSSSDSSGYIETITQSGVHNTPSLLSKKDAISVLAYGLVLSYKIKNIKAGIIWTENKLSLPMDASGNNPEKFFEFTGTKNDLYSAYLNLFIKKILLYGEFTLSCNDKHALVFGSSFRPADRLSLNIVFRDYSPGFTTFYGHGPGMSSKTSNEKGILGNFTFEAAKHLFISGGVDIAQFPWLKYRNSAPTMKIRKELKISYLPVEKLVIDASYNYRLSMNDAPSATGIPEQKELSDRSIRLSVRYALTSRFTAGMRGDYKIVEPTSSRGFILCQDLNYSFVKVPVTLWARYCLFSSGDWNSRIYAYENDLLYSLSIPALSGKGTRSYIMVKWKISDAAEIRMKYGITSTVSEGGTIKNSDEIKMQFRVWF